MTEVNEAFEKREKRQTQEKKKKMYDNNSHLHSPMPPRKFPTPQLKAQAAIGTRSQNKNVHPGKPVLDAKQNRRSKQEMDELRAQKAQQVDDEKVRLVKGLKTAAQIEDDLLQEDIQRRTSNHRSEGITPFNPHLRAVGSDIAKPSSVSAASRHDSTDCGLSVSVIR